MLMDGRHLNQLLDEAAARRPGPSGRGGRSRRVPELCRVAARSGPDGDPADALGRRPRRPRGPLVAQGPRGGDRGPRHPPRRRGLCTGRPDGARHTCRRHPGHGGRQGGSGCRRPGAGPPRGLARRRSPAPVDHHRRGDRAGEPDRTRRCALGRGPGRRRPLTAGPPTRRGQPGVHPLHLGIDRTAQRRHALARQRADLPGLVPGRARALVGRRPLLLARALAFRPVGLRPVRRLPQCGDAGPDRRGAGQGPRPARRLPGRASDRRLVLGAVDPVADGRARGPWTVRDSPRRGWSSSPARSSRSARSDGFGPPGRGRGCGTSMDQPRRTSARRYPIPDDHPGRPRHTLPDWPGLCRRSEHGSSTPRARTHRRARSASW